METATGRRQKKKTGYCYPLITPPRARRGRAAEAGMEPEDAAAGVQDDVLLESLLPDDLTELGAAQAEKAQRAVVWRSNDDVTKELQQRLAAGNGQRYDVKQGDLRQPDVRKRPKRPRPPCETAYCCEMRLRFNENQICKRPFEANPERLRQFVECVEAGRNPKERSELLCVRYEVHNKRDEVVMMKKRFFIEDGKMFEQRAPPMAVFVTHKTTYKIWGVLPQDKVAVLMARVEKHSKVPVATFQLLNSGHVLDEARTLEDYSICSGTFLKMRLGAGQLTG